VIRRAAPVIAALVASAALGLSAGCPSDPRAEVSPPVVAEVGEWQISRAAFAAELARAGASRVEGQEARLAVARRIVQRMVDEHLLHEAARKAGVDIDDKDVSREAQNAADGYPPGVFQRMLHAEKLTFEDYRAAVRRRLRIERFTRAELARLPKVTAAEVKARYEASVAGRARPPEVHVRQILVRTREEGEHIRREVTQGRTTMEAAARRYSEAPDAEQGGDLGWFGKGDMPPVFDVCFSMKQGEVSGVVPSVWGFHLFEVVDQRPGREETFEEAEERLVEEIRRERQTKGLDDLKHRLRKDAKAEIHEAALASAVDALGPPPKDEPVAEGPQPVDAPEQPAQPEEKKPEEASK
jgi:parvulin-like peptidyl-prolyl isomerase